MDDLQELKRLTIALNQTNSSNEKMRTLATHPQCKKLLRYTYDPFKQYFVSSKNLIKNSDLRESLFTHTDIFELLDDLDARTITGHEAIGAVNQFIDQNLAYKDLIYNIIDGNLKTRTDAKLINKVWPGTVPSFSVALAQKFEDHAKKVDFSKGEWFASRKLDGIRVITIIDGHGKITFLSRRGKEFTTLGVVKKALQKLKLGSVVFDGEMCIVDEKTGDEDFTDMIKLIRRKEFTVPNPRYKIFDYLSLDTFNNEKGGPKLSIRYGQLKNVIPNSAVLDPVEQIPITSLGQFKKMRSEASEKGWEGLILRKNTNYEGKRSSGMLKVKSFHDMEFIVKDVEMGPIRFIQNGKEVTEDMLSAIKVEYKNNIVSVGSGFSMDQRRAFYKDPSLILGKEVTVKYFEETKNEKGLYSLRFPTLKAIYDKRDM